MRFNVCTKYMRVWMMLSQFSGLVVSFLYTTGEYTPPDSIYTIQKCIQSFCGVGLLFTVVSMFFVFSQLDPTKIKKTGLILILIDMIYVIAFLALGIVSCDKFSDWDIPVVINGNNISFYYYGTYLAGLSFGQCSLYLLDCGIIAFDIYNANNETTRFPSSFENPLHRTYVQIQLPYANHQPNELQVNQLKQFQQQQLQYPPPYEQNFQPQNI